MKTLEHWFLCIVIVALSGCLPAKAKHSSPERGAERQSDQDFDAGDPGNGKDIWDTQPGNAVEPEDPDPPNNEEEDFAETQASCYKGDPFICEIEAAIVRQTNQLRAPSPPLQHSAKMSYVARLWSASMGKIGFISHFGFPRSRTADYRDEFGASASMMAENVAMNYSNSQAAEDIAQSFTKMWWNSFGHRRNMQGNYPTLGVGVFKSGSRYYATQIFGRD